MTCSGKSYICSYSAETNSTTELLKIQIVLDSTDLRIKKKKTEIQLIMQFSPKVSRKVLADRIS